MRVVEEEIAHVPIIILFIAELYRAKSYEHNEFEQLQLCRFIFRVRLSRIASHTTALLKNAIDMALKIKSILFLRYCLLTIKIDKLGYCFLLCAFAILLNAVRDSELTK